MDTPYSVSFKILSRNPSLKKRLAVDDRILSSTRDAKCCSQETTYQARSAGLREPTDSQPKQTKHDSQKLRALRAFSS
jgi:hypothetical protein